MRSFVLASILIAATPAVALAHITLTSPLPRSSQQKAGPCGVAGSVRSANPTVFEPGATITVTWNETINHPGHYRVSFDIDGVDFTTPQSFTDLTQTDNVLFDNITDSAASGSSYSQEITLPDVACENCTIQLIQMMTDKPPYSIPGDDIYYQCADIALRAGGVPGPDAGDGGNPADPDGGIADDGDDSPAIATGGCATSTGGTGPGILALGLAVVLVRRRRPRS